MEISVLASGSNGNSTLVEKDGVSVLLDAGKSCKELTRRLEVLGKDVSQIDAVVVSHEHSDHIRGIDVLSRKHNLPVYTACGEFPNFKPFSIGDTLNIKGMEIQTIPVSHDVPACGFVIGKFGLFTDTGIVTNEMQKQLPNLNAVLLEANHDVDMLLAGPYPPMLKQRVLSDKGHLSNFDSSHFLQDKGNNISLAILGHLSGYNNSNEKVIETHETFVKRKMETVVASRDDVTGSFKL